MDPVNEPRPEPPERDSHQPSGAPLPAPGAGYRNPLAEHTIGSRKAASQWKDDPGADRLARWSDLIQHPADFAKLRQESGAIGWRNAVQNIAALFGVEADSGVRVWSTNPITNQILHGRCLTPEVWCYRMINPCFLARGDKLEGNNHSCAGNLMDLYTGRMATSAQHLAHPGISVSAHPFALYGEASLDPRLVRFKLGAALDLGARIYLDLGSGSFNAIYLTVPTGKAIPVQLLSKEVQDLILSDACCSLGAKTYDRELKLRSDPGDLRFKNDPEFRQLLAARAKLYNLIDDLVKLESGRVESSSSGS